MNGSTTLTPLEYDLDHTLWTVTLLVNRELSGKMIVADWPVARWPPHFPFKNVAPRTSKAAWNSLGTSFATITSDGR